ncbi:hypothetical protein MG296_10000 [Flavobacteriaceae bacterium TK19130]|nr:hypothetical protein [Thermobacterium salinum]
MEPTHEQYSVDDGKTIAIISYFTVIGLIIAYLLNNDKNNPFAAFHIRQSLGLIVTGLAVWFVITIFFMMLYIPWLDSVLYLVMVVLWLFGLVGAVQGQKKPVPVLGEEYQKWFAGI